MDADDNFAGIGWVAQSFDVAGHAAAQSNAAAVGSATRGQTASPGTSSAMRLTPPGGRLAPSPPATGGHLPESTPETTLLFAPAKDGMPSDPADQSMLLNPRGPTLVRVRSDASVGATQNAGSASSPRVVRTLSAWMRMQQSMSGSASGLFSSVDEATGADASSELETESSYVPRSVYLRVLNDLRVERSNFFREINTLHMHNQRLEISARALREQLAASGATGAAGAPTAYGSLAYGRGGGAQGRSATLNATIPDLATSTTAASRQLPPNTDSPALGVSFQPSRPPPVQTNATALTRAVSASAVGASAASTVSPVLPVANRIPFHVIADGLRSAETLDAMEAYFEERLAIDTARHDACMSEVVSLHRQEVATLRQQLLAEKQAAHFVRASTDLACEKTRNALKSKYDADHSAVMQKLEDLELRARQADHATQSMQATLLERDGNILRLTVQLSKLQMQNAELLHERGELREVLQSIVGRVALNKQGHALAHANKIRAFVGLGVHDDTASNRGGGAGGGGPVGVTPSDMQQSSPGGSRRPSHMQSPSSMNAAAAHLARTNLSKANSVTATAAVLSNVGSGVTIAEDDNMDTLSEIAARHRHRERSASLGSGIGADIAGSLEVELLQAGLANNASGGAGGSRNAFVKSPSATLGVPGSHRRLSSPHASWAPTAAAGAAHVSPPSLQLAGGGPSPASARQNASTGTRAKVVIQPRDPGLTDSDPLR